MDFWLNGDWRDSETAISVNDRGMLLADGVFETLLVRKGAPVFLDAHLQRLKLALAAMSIDAELPENPGAVLSSLCAKNDVVNGSVRLTVTRGPSGRGLSISEDAQSTVMITAAQGSPAPEPGSTPTPAKLIVSRYQRAPGSLTARFKTLAYLDNVMARHQAATEGADEALLLNPAGAIACASAANVFAIFPDGRIRTPKVSEGALPGIVRGKILNFASQTDIVVEEASLTPETISDAMVFLTNSLIGLRAAFLDEDKRPDGAEEIFNQLRSWYDQALQSDVEERKSSG